MQTPGPQLEVQDQQQNAGNDEEMVEGENGNGPNGGPKRRFMRQPIPKKIKRLRRNRRLRKILTPKNALMSLHELLGTGLSEFNILPEERGFVASVFVNNVQYEGRGESNVIKVTKFNDHFSYLLELFPIDPINFRSIENGS